MAKHMMALTVKRFHHSRRNKKGFICEVSINILYCSITSMSYWKIYSKILLPAFFVCLAMIFTLILPALVEEPPLEISPWIYPTRVSFQTRIPFKFTSAFLYFQGGQNTFFYSVENKDSFWARKYRDEIISFRGLGTQCIAK